MHGRRRLLAVLFLLHAPPWSGIRAEEDEPAPDPLPVPEGSRDPVSSEKIRGVAGEEVPLLDSPVAASVFTGDDLRAMGVTTIPEAFRYLPGVDVFQLNGFTHAVGIRGVDDEFNPRVQVYLDGRLVNVAEFGGVDWENIPVSIDDIDRLEVIRAVGVPGEAGSGLLGAVRIWTRRPGDIPPLTYSAYIGEEMGQAHFGRAGVSLGPLAAKGTLEYRSDDGVPGLNSIGLDDGQGLLKLNFQGSFTLGEMAGLDIRLTALRGEVEETSGEPISSGPTRTENYTVSASFHGLLPSGLHFSLAYHLEEFGLKVEDYPFAFLYGTRDIDLNRYTHSFHGAARMPLRSFWDFLLSCGFRDDRLHFERNVPMSDDQEMFHLHLGTEMRPVEPLHFTAGIQIERDLFAGWHASPSAGAVLHFLPRQALRLSFRTGARKPSFSETRTAFVIPNPFPPPATIPLIAGNPSLEEETLLGYELGYRGGFPLLGLVFDQQLFLHDLKDKVVFVPDLSSAIPGALTFDNEGAERVLGTETFAEWQAIGPITLRGSYAFQKADDQRTDRRIGQRPQHRANAGLRLQFRQGNLRGISAFFNVNYVSRIEQVDASGVEHAIDHRFRVDLRLAKRFLKDRLEVSLIGRNLFDNETLEFRPSLGSNWDGAFGSPRMVLFNIRFDL